MSNREEQIEAEIKALSAEREELRKNRFWCCPRCKQKTKINTLEIVQFYYYDIEDWSTTGSYEIQCPKCNKSSSGYKDRDGWTKVHDLLYYFKKIIKKSRSSGMII